MNSPITTHVLDTARGRPAAGIDVTLERLEAGDRWQMLGRDVTNVDGRARALLPGDWNLEPGVYRLTFDTGTYFRGLGVEGFYPHVPVVFGLERPESHYHVPLLLSPYGYSTYRGS